MSEPTEIKKEGYNGLDDRYWIKQGIQVKLNGTDLIMMVDNLTYKNYQIPDGHGGQRSEKRLMGVKCHWVDKDHKYQTGLFHTRELTKYEPTDTIR